VAEPASPDHQRCRVVTGRLGVVFPQGPQPVLGGPAGSVGGIDDDDRQARVAGHLDQPVAELAGGDPGDRAPEPPSPLAARGPAGRPLASLGAGLGEVEVLDDEGAGTSRPGGGDQGADGGAQAPVAGGSGEPGQVQGNGGRGAEDVAVRRDDGGGEVAAVDVDGFQDNC